MTAPIPIPVAGEGDSPIERHTTPTSIRPKRSHSVADAFKVKPEDAANNCILDGLIYKHGYSIISAPPKAQKTFVALDMAFAVASGQSFLGQQTQQGPVLYIDLENNWEDVLAPRISALCKGRGLDPADVEIYVEQPEMFLLDTQEGLDGLEFLMHSYRPVLVVIDPLVAALSEDENDNLHVRRTLAGVKSLATKYDCAILLLHHTRKPQAGRKYRMTSADSRGAGDATAGSDVSIILSGENQQGVNTLTVDFCRRKRTVDSLRFQVVDDDDQVRVEPSDLAKAETKSSAAKSKILSLLQGGDYTQSEMCEQLSLRKDLVSKATKDLRSEGLITERDGRKLGLVV